jgi:hypothetical protein
MFPTLSRSYTVIWLLKIFYYLSFAREQYLSVRISTVGIISIKISKKKTVSQSRKKLICYPTLNKRQDLDPDPHFKKPKPRSA